MWNLSAPPGGGWSVLHFLTLLVYFLPYSCSQWLHPTGHQRYSGWSTTPQFPSTTSAPPAKLAEIPVVAPEAEFSFHANDTLMHVRTDSWMLSYNTCLEARFRLEGKRTRLLIYTCRMVEGGMCILDKFLADPYNPRSEGSIDKERCHKLRPWMFAAQPFAFHFRFVRRPRKFADKETEERHRRRRHGKRALREVGRVTLKGFKECDRVCRKGSGGWQEEESTPNKRTMEINIVWWEERGLSKKQLKHLMKTLRFEPDLSLFCSHIREAVPFAELIINWLIFILHHWIPWQWPAMATGNFVNAFFAENYKNLVSLPQTSRIHAPVNSGAHQISHSVNQMLQRRALKRRRNDEDDSIGSGGKTLESEDTLH